jgi:hypothetical protein
MVACSSAVKRSLNKNNKYSQGNSCYHRIKTFTCATDRHPVIHLPLTSLSCLRGSLLYLQVTLTVPKITFSARFFICSSSCSDNAIQVGKRISWLVCTVESKAYLKECDVE